MKFPSVCRWRILFYLGLFLPVSVQTLKAQVHLYSFQTLAGAPHLELIGPAGLATDAEGNLLVADAFAIARLSAGGKAGFFAGSYRQDGGWDGGASDGQGGAAKFNGLAGMARDGQGRLYLADSGNRQIRVVDTNANVSTLHILTDAGETSLPDRPVSLAIGGDGSVCLTLQNQNAIYKVDPAGHLAPFAGLPLESGFVDGRGTGARFLYPLGLAWDAQGNLWVTDAGNGAIRKITPGGDVSTVITSGMTTSQGVAIQGAQGLAFDAEGNLFVASPYQRVVFKVVLQDKPVISILAGQVQVSGRDDGDAAHATFSYPAELAVGREGQLYVSDQSNRSVRLISRDGLVSTALGSDANLGSRDGAGPEARFNHPRAVAVDPDGTVFVADTLNHAIRKISLDGVVSTLAGKAGTNGDTDGKGADARFDYPGGIAVDGQGNVYVADTGNHLIRKVTPAGEVSTAAGTRGLTGLQDGIPGAFTSPSGLAVGKDGVIYVADTGNNAVRKVMPDGTVATVTSERALDRPLALALTPDGNLNVIEDGNVYYLTVLLPDGSAKFLQDFGSTDARPTGLTADDHGNIFLTEHRIYSVRQVFPTGEGLWIAGGTAGFADGAGPGAQFQRPAGIAVDRQGFLYVADEGNSTIRKGSPYRGAGIAAGPLGGEVLSGYDFSFQVTAAGDPPFAYQWRFNGTNLAGATNAILSLAGVTTNEAGFYDVIVSNAFGPAAGSEPVKLDVLAVAPTVTVKGPSSAIVGAEVTLTASASGSRPLTYQWFFADKPLADQTNAVLQLTNVVPSQSGTYAITATNPHGSATRNVSLTVSPVPLSVVAIPNQTVYANNDVLILAVTAGSGPIRGQWLFQGVPLVGATNSSLSLPRIRKEDAGAYALALSGPYGSFTSSPTAILKVVDGPPMITRQPGGQDVRNGHDASFSVAAQGTGPLSYQWRKDAQNLEGATNSSLKLSGVTADEAGVYSVSVANGLGEKTSNEAVLTVGPAAEAGPPGDRAVILGDEVALASPGTGFFPDTYQWLQTSLGIPLRAIPGADQPGLVISNASVLQSGALTLRTWLDYSVRIANQSGVGATSRVAIVSTFPTNASLLPVGLTGWSHDVVLENGPVSRIDVAFDNSSIPAYHTWIEAGVKSRGDGLPPSRRFASAKDPRVIFEFQPYAGPNALWLYASTYTNQTAALRLTHPAHYSRLAVLAATTYGSGENSPGAMVLQFSDGTCSDTLRLNCPDWWVGNSTNFLALAGLAEGYATTRTASKDSQLGYGYPTAVTPYGLGLYQTDVDLTALGLADRELVAITFQAPRLGQPTGIFAVSGRELENPGRPYLVAEPQTQAVRIGDQVRLTCLALGDPPIEYQWRKDGIIIPQVSGPELTLTALATAEYAVTASNASGAVTSVPARVEARTPPTFAINPGDRQLVLSWTSPDYVLERRDTMDSGTDWRPVNYGITPMNGQFTFALDVNSGSSFFRLRLR